MENPFTCKHLCKSSRRLAAGHGPYQRKVSDKATAGFELGSFDTKALRILVHPLSLSFVSSKDGGRRCRSGIRTGPVTGFMWL
jgi:hypothetical protein